MQIANFYPWQFGDCSVWVRRGVERRACFLHSSAGPPVLQFPSICPAAPALSQSAAKAFSLLGWKPTRGPRKVSTMRYILKIWFPYGESGCLAWAHVTWPWLRTSLIRISLCDCWQIVPRYDEMKLPLCWGKLISVQQMPARAGFSWARPAARHTGPCKD